TPRHHEKNAGPPPPPTKPRTSQPPMRPVAPVTRTGRSSQNPLLVIPILSRARCHPAKGFPEGVCLALYPCIARSRRAGTRQVGARRPVVPARLPPDCCHHL